MTFQELLNIDCTQLMEINRALETDQADKSDEFVDLCNKTAEFTRLFNLYQQSPYNLTAKDRKQWNRAFSDMAKAAKKYAEDHEGIKLTSQGRFRQRKVRSLFKLAYGMKNRIYNVGKTIQETDKFEQDFSDGSLDSSIARMHDYMVSQKPRMYPADCFDPETYKLGTKKFVTNLLWLADQELADREASGREAVGEYSTGIYGSALKKMMDSLANASEYGQNWFAMWMEMYRTILIDRLAASMEQYQAEEREGNPESLQVRLYKDPDYRKLESLSLLEQGLGNGAKQLSLHFRNSESFKNRASVKKIQQFLPGRLEEALRQEGTLVLAGQARRDAALSDVKSTGYGQNEDDIRQLFDTYKTMMEDTASASYSFDAARRSLGKFLSLDHAHIADKEAYLGDLTIALETAENYLNTHRAKIHYVHKYGRVRRNCIDSVKRILSAKKEQLQKELRQEEKKNQRDELERLGRVHRVTATKFIPQGLDRDLSQSKISRFFGTMFHGIANGIAYLSSFALRKPLALMNFFKRKQKAAAARNRFDQIPLLSTKEKFEKFDPDSMPADQEIISDVRRTPLVWERKIDGDPAQEPTFSIYAEESEEGSERAHGLFGGDVGHTFISLEYTKNDPITGTPQRYRTTFGFYPNKTDSQELVFAASGLKGSTLPGTLINDWDHPSNAGITFKVSNRQINRVLLAAQNYAQGGYNMITRNCTNFAKDMAEEAGLDVKNLFYMTDFEAGAGFTAATGAALPIGDFLYMLGKDALNKDIRKEEVNSYQLYGQQHISDEEVKHFSNIQMNLRMKGYNPSRLAEAIKASGKGTLIHTHWNSQRSPELEKEDLGFAERKTAETEAFMRELDRIIRERHLPEGENIRADLQEMLQNLDALKENIKQGFHLEKREGETIVDVYRRSERNLKLLGNKLEQAEKNIDAYFRNILHADQELYIPFQHLISFLDSYRLQTEDYLLNLDGNISRSIDNHEEYDPDRLALKHMDVLQREDSAALAEYRFGLCVSRHIEFTVLENAAHMLVYKNNDTIHSDIERFNQLFDAEQNGTITSAQIVEKDQINDRMKLYDAVKNHLSYYASAKKLTKGDTDLIFGSITNTCADNAVDVFHAFAWRLGLDPTKDQFKTAVLNAVNVNAVLLRSNVSGKSTQEEQKTFLDDMTLARQSIIDEGLRIAVGAMNPQNEQFHLILQSIIRNAELQLNHKDYPTDPEEIKAFRQTVFDKAISDFMGSVANAVLWQELKYVLPEISNSTGVTEERLMTFIEPAFADMREKFGKIMDSVGHHLYPENWKDDYIQVPLNDAEKALMPHVSWLAEEIYSSHGFSQIYPETAEQFTNLRREINAMKARHDLSPEAKQLQQGLGEIWKRGMQAVQELANDANMKRAVLNRDEIDEIKQKIGKLAFTVFAEKLDDESRKRIAEKIMADPKAYDKYVSGLTKSSEFERMLKEPAPLKPNQLCNHGMMRNLITRIETGMGNDFNKILHINNVRQRGPEPRLQAGLR